MIRSFRSRALAAFWHGGSAAKIRPDLVARLTVRLSRLDVAATPADMNVPGFNFHRLQGKSDPLHGPRERPLVHHLRVGG